jgi:V-type H+-transporting ATPase subunit B
LKAVVGEEALSADEFLYLEFLENFEKTYVTQGAYENRDVFASLDKAWELLRTFPRDALKKIDDSIKDKFYPRGLVSGAPDPEDDKEEKHH